MWWRLLPALLPSWQFFDVIGPAPRIEYRWLSSSASPVGAWRPFRPRPAHLNAAQLIGRLCWNPAWNETLYVMRCAERVLEGDTGFPVAELARRMRRELPAAQENPQATLFEMRILAAQRQAHQITYLPVYHSAALTLRAPG